MFDLCPETGSPLPTKINIKSFLDKLHTIPYQNKDTHEDIKICLEELYVFIFIVKIVVL